MKLTFSLSADLKVNCRVKLLFKNGRFQYYDPKLNSNQFWRGFYHGFKSRGSKNLEYFIKKHHRKNFLIMFWGQKLVFRAHLAPFSQRFVLYFVGIYGTHISRYYWVIKWNELTKHSSIPRFSDAGLRTDYSRKNTCWKYWLRG